ncbi:hypothetical protein O988_01245 [Pseudogymnoascus sp. VKM F-3808]|nr:hypothetical protein O988_01245 [Pseudogymnoascus sp. VKM F-3808]
MASPTEETEPQLSCNDRIPWSLSSPDVTFVLDPRPPARVRANDGLQIVALLTCHPAQLHNIPIFAVATIARGFEASREIRGCIVGSLKLASSTTTKFCFTLAFPSPGKFRVFIHIERFRPGQDHDNWVYIASEEITVTSFDQDHGQDSEGTSIIPLHTREVDIEDTYDTELFPWKISKTPPPEVVLGGITYNRNTVFIPEAEFISKEGFSDYGEGLFDDRYGGEWHEIDENKARSGENEEDEVLDGDDGRKYRRSRGCLESYYVGLRREVVMIDEVRHIGHLVLVDSGKHWDEGSTSRLSVALSPDGTRLAEASDNTVKIQDTAKGVVLLTLDGHTDAVYSVAFSSNGMKIASASYDKTLNIWDAVRGTLLQTLDSYTTEMSSVVISPDGTKVALSYDKARNLDTGALKIDSSYDKVWNIWNTDTGDLLLTHEDHICGPVTFSPDSRKIASASADKKLNIRDTNTGILLLMLVGHPDGMFSVAFSPNGMKIASASYNSTVNIWDIDTGALVLTLESYTYSVRLLVFSPDSKLLALASDEAMCLWDYTKDATPQMLRDTRGKSFQVETMTFSPDGKELISASLNMEMWRWDTTSGSQHLWKNLIFAKLLQPPPLSKRPNEGDIGGNLRNKEVNESMKERMDELRKLRNPPDYDPTTTQILQEI